MPDCQNRAVSGDIDKVKCFSELDGQVAHNLALTRNTMNATIILVKGTSTGKEEIGGVMRVAE
jgi:hypothetical protein